MMELTLETPTWLLIFHRAGAVLLALAAAYLGYRLARRGLRGLQDNGVLVDGVRRLLQGAIKFIVVFIAILVTLQQLGVSISAIWAFVSALAAMVAIGFVAFWSVLSNALCTLILIMTKPFSVGDDIAVLDTTNPTNTIEGQVRNISVFHTILKEKGKSNSELLIPNNLFFQKYLRRREGKRTYGLDEQIFKAKSLLIKEVTR